MPIRPCSSGATCGGSQSTAREWDCRARFDISLPDRERLAQGSAALSGDDDMPALAAPPRRLPLLLREVSLVRHGLSRFHSQWLFTGEIPREVSQFVT